MIRLIITSFIWAFSFSLIGHFIAGQIDTYLAIFLRLIFALAIFLPFIKVRNIFTFNGLKILGIGALQIGLMYILYFNSFKYLPVVEVALFTVTTPLYISIIGSLLNRSFNLKQLVNILLVVLGAAIIKWNSVTSNFMLGFLLVQGANISFGLGQVLYKRYLSNSNQKGIFGLFYLGALIPISVLVALYSDLNVTMISNTQWAVLVWLGVVASGIGYFLWNSGAKLVSYGELATMNNVVIPLAILVNIMLWGNSVNWMSFGLGSFVLTLGVYLELKKEDWPLYKNLTKLFK